MLVLMQGVGVFQMIQLFIVTICCMGFNAAHFITTTSKDCIQFIYLEYSDQYSCYINTYHLMDKTELANRKDVRLLVTQFYTKVRADNEIGHFFNETIHDWPEHITKLVDFWETNLFFVQKYKANPLQVHADLDKKMGHTITNYHFGIWLRHWIETID